MSRLVPIHRLVLTLGLFGLMSAASLADGETPPATSAPKFTVWCGGGCSRSLHEVQSHPDVKSALAAAESLKKTSAYVLVLEGDATWGDAYDAYNVLRGVSKETNVRCSVYERSCRRSGWQVNEAFGATDYKKAAERVASLKESRVEAAMVYHSRKPSEP